MDGLECNEINFKSLFKNKDFRIDSSFYTKLIYKNKNLNYLPINKILSKSQYGISISMNEEKIGYPIYRMNEINNMLCDLEPSKYANISHKEMLKFKLKNGDILFNRTNSYEWVGRTGIYYQNDTNGNIFASYLIRFNTNKIILPEYLVAFLSSKQGIIDIKRRARQSINQTNVNPEEVKEIEIPILDIAIQSKIQDAFITANKLRLKSVSLYSQAEQLLIDELGLVNFKASTKNIAVKKLYESFNSSGRLDAEYYQPKYDEIFSLVKKFNTDILIKLASIKKSIEPGSDYYADEGIPFVRVSDISKNGIQHPSIKIPLNTIENIESLYLKKDTILLSKDGSVGIAYKVEEDLEYITSGALLHLNILDKKRILPDYLTLVLNSIVVQLQAERDTSGAIIKHWKPSKIEKVIIPILDIDIQEIISEKVQQSFTLRRQSNQLLEQAKQAVEIAIEQGEKTAIEFLNSNN